MWHHQPTKMEDLCKNTPEVPDELVDYLRALVTADIIDLEAIHTVVRVSLAALT